MGYFLKSVCRILFSAGLVFSLSFAQMGYKENKDKGTLTIYEGPDQVLTYCFKDQLKRGADPSQVRSCYIHPLYSLEGKILTHDFPKDHPHHHGVFWTWPVVKTRGKNTQTWHPDTPSLRQHFNQWLRRSEEKGAFVLSVENLWKLEGKETVAKEILTLCIHPADPRGRAVDIKITIEAVGGKLELQGAPEQSKGYGGLCFRGAPMFKGVFLTTDQGPLHQDSTNRAFRWADLSTEEQGVAVFIYPEHPDFPPDWLIRNSYAGILNVSWPGLKPAVFQPGEPVTLSYRIYLHQGNAQEGKVKEAYQEYILTHKKDS